MPRQMARTHDERRRQIIDGALQVFALKGFDAATNKAIAAAAGIGSAGLIYHYFRDKKDLLAHVLTSHIPVVQMAARPDEIMAMPTREALYRIGGAYLRIMESPEAIAMMRLIFGEAVRSPEVAAVVNEAGPGRVLGFLGAYLERQMDAGAIRRGDPAATARCFMGPLITYVWLRVVLRQPDPAGVAPDVMLRTTVETFLDGARVR